MKKSILAMTLVSLIAANTVNAKEHDFKKEENIGFGSGLLVGAIAGGPLGAIIGGIGGVFIGHSVAADNKLTELDQELDANAAQIHQLLSYNQQLLARLESQKESMKVQLASLNDQQQITDNQALTMHIQFRTGSSQIESLYKQQLEQLAQALSHNKTLGVNLAGFADRRGSDQDNLSLSSNRVNSVKQLLVNSGIAKHRISTDAFGEQFPVDSKDNFEGNAFDRRVTLTLSKSPKQMASLH